MAWRVERFPESGTRLAVGSAGIRESTTWDSKRQWTRVRGLIPSASMQHLRPLRGPEDRDAGEAGWQPASPASTLSCQCPALPSPVQTLPSPAQPCPALPSPCLFEDVHVGLLELTADLVELPVLLAGRRAALYSGTARRPSPPADQLAPPNTILPARGSPTVQPASLLATQPARAPARRGKHASSSAFPISPPASHPALERHSNLPGPRVKACVAWHARAHKRTSARAHKDIYACLANCIKFDVSGSAQSCRRSRASSRSCSYALTKWPRASDRFLWWCLDQAHKLQRWQWAESASHSASQATS